MAFHPDGETVALAWLRTLDLDVDGIGNELPATAQDWAERGFVQVPQVVGGTPHVHLPLRQPVVEINAWTNRPRSEQPPWRRAGHIAGEIVAAIDGQREPVDLDLGAAYRRVRLLSVWANTEPRRMLGDPSNYARFVFEAEMRWVVLPDG